MDAVGLSVFLAIWRKEALQGTWTEARWEKQLCTTCQQRDARDESVKSQSDCGLWDWQ